MSIDRAARTATAGRAGRDSGHRAGAATRRCTLLLPLLAVPLPAQILTPDAGVRAPELPSVRELVTLSRTGRTDEMIATTEVVYSPHRRFELELDVPYVVREIEQAGSFPGGTVDGLGDLTLRGKFGLVRDDDRMSSDRVALLLAAMFPTGSDEETVAGVLLPPRLQPGMGSFGVEAGLAGTIVRDRHRASAALRYRHHDEHNGFQHGDEIELDLAWWFRLSPAAFSADGDEPEWRLVAELLGVHRFDDDFRGFSLDDGGPKLDVLLGLQLNTSSGGQRFELGVRLPVFDDTESAPGDLEIGVVLAATFYF